MAFSTRISTSSLDSVALASYTKVQAVLESTPNDTLPSSAALQRASSSLPTSLPESGLGDEAASTHLISDLIPGFDGPKSSANYYGFVTGGVFPIAEVADNIVTAFDQNVQVHLPAQTVSTVVEDRALLMLIDLLALGDGWEGRAFTTGATGANILGLACGRESVTERRLADYAENGGVGELGLLAACTKAGIEEIQLLTSMPHSSLAKAASVVGLGRAAVKDIPANVDEPWIMNIAVLERELKLEKEGVVSIVVVSAGEVNTGRFAVDGLGTMKRIRALCDEHGAWLHIDGAFGAFARCLPKTPEFSTLLQTTLGLELADSIAGDAHKMLNVPYDCGFFLTRSTSTLSSVFRNPNAAYLSSGPSSIPSPLNIGLENSRRFRALPVYAVLLSLGRIGLSEMFARQVRLARAISEFLMDHEEYLLLPGNSEIENREEVLSKTHIIVIFRAKDAQVNAELVEKIDATRKIYVSGTKWSGEPACRIAVSTWKVDVERDLSLVKEVLEEVLT